MTFEIRMSPERVVGDKHTPCAARSVGQDDERRIFAAPLGRVRRDEPTRPAVAVFAARSTWWCALRTAIQARAGTTERGLDFPEAAPHSYSRFHIHNLEHPIPHSSLNLPQLFRIPHLFLIPHSIFYIRSTFGT